MNDGITYRIQGIRVLRSRSTLLNNQVGPRRPVIRARFSRANNEGGLLRSPPEWRAYTDVCTRMLRIYARRRP